jgi:hypothetical protein
VTTFKLPECYREQHEDGAPFLRAEAELRLYLNPPE